MISPFLILFLFNHPTPEDFSWSESTRSYGFVQAQKFFYNIWSGRFFSYSLLSLNPLLLKSIAGYKVFLLLFFLLFLYVTFVFISCFTKNVLLLRERILITLSVIFLYLYSMPSVSEGLYWLTAVMIYPLGIMLIMLFIYFYKKSEETKVILLRNNYILISSLIIVAAAGTSELTSALIFVLTILLLVRNILMKKDLKWISSFFVVIAGISVFAAFSSPGNYSRSEYFKNSHNLIYSLQFSFTYLIKSLSSWIFNSPLLVFTVLLSPLLLKLINRREENSDRFSKKIIYKFLSLFFLLYAIIFATVWNIGEAPYGRTVNIAYFIFLLGWFYNFMFLLSYIDRRVKINFNKFPKYLYVMIFLFISLFLIKKNNIRNAFAESLRGSAYNYDQRLSERYKIILENSSENCQVDTVKHVPKSFFLYDITTDSAHLYNQWYSQYFNKQTITLKKH